MKHITSVVFRGFPSKFSLSTILLLALLHLTLAGGLSSCSKIAVEDRLSYYDPTSGQQQPTDTATVEGLTKVQQNILLEDFTGQKCKNCPEGAKAIDGIIEQYGEEHVIPVAIHCGQFGFEGDAQYAGLMTQLGREYFNRWFKSNQSQPVAKINRGEANDNYDEWVLDVAKYANNTTYISWNTKASYKSDTRELSITLTAVGPTGTKGYLQLWLVEDGITGMQLMPDGSVNTQYTHNHILREAINGTWGEYVTLSKEPLTITHTYILPQQYNPNNCHIVSFFYDDDGVKQAYKKKMY